MHAFRSPLVIAFALAAASLAACQSAPPPRVSSDVAAGADLQQYRTYAFHSPLSTDRAGYSSLTTGYLKAAVQREMQQRGYVFQEEAPELLVNFNVTTRETLANSTSPRIGVGYGGWSGGGVGMGMGVSTGGGVEQVLEGTLTIDVVDRAKSQLVWTGSVAGRLPQDAASNPAPIVDQAVALVFQKYPSAPR